MLNRAATKIDLNLEEELGEFEKMKELRTKNLSEFQSKYCFPSLEENNSSFDNEFGPPTNGKGNQNNIFDFSLSQGKDVSDFGFTAKNNNPPQNIMEFSINALFNSSSSGKNGYIQTGNVEAFQTPHNK